MSKSVPQTARYMNLYYIFGLKVEMLGAHRFSISWSCQIAEFLIPSVAVNPEQQDYDIKRDER